MTYRTDLKELRQMLRNSERHNPNGYSAEQVFQWMKLAYIKGTKHKAEPLVCDEAKSEESKK